MADQAMQCKRKIPVMSCLAVNETKKWDYCGLSAAAFTKVLEIWVVESQEAVMSWSKLE